VEDAIVALLRTSPNTQRPPYWRFGAVKGALFRLEWMGAAPILRAIAHLRSELHSLVPGFHWESLDSALTQALPGGKGRDLKEMGRFQRGHVCTILICAVLRDADQNEGVYTI